MSLFNVSLLYLGTSSEGIISVITFNNCLTGHIHNNSVEDEQTSGPQSRLLKYDSNSKPRKEHNKYFNGGDNDGLSRNSLSSGTRWNMERRKPSTVPPRVDADVRKHVEWFDDTQYYALRSSPDSKFRIRYAPAPARGSPWPMPQVYQPTNVSFRVIADGSFEFHSVGEQCALLDEAFVRFRRNVFSIDQMTVRHDDLSGAQSEIHSVNVTVLKECTHYPYLDMDESCECLIMFQNITFLFTLVLLFIVDCYIQKFAD